MERFQGPITSCFIEQGFFNTECLRFHEEQEQEFLFSTEDKMPFLQMLQCVEPSTTPFLPFKEPNFQTLLKLQHVKKPWEVPIELESCVTTTTTHVDLIETASESNQEQPNSSLVISKPLPVIRERRKRKRTKSIRNKEQVESQRMTHIAVERNRRKQMNEHLNSLRSLMPPSYVQRGDQASIIGGAIDFVKELEQLLQSLESQKQMRSSTENDGEDEFPINEIFASSPRFEIEEENKSEADEIEAIVIQDHVNLKIQCPKRHGQLLKAIVALEDLRLSVLHLNITTTTQDTVLYSFNLKIEDNCNVGSAEEIRAAVRQIFSFIQH